ncbi:acyl carrier protein [Streptomyces sp. NPDC037389]|uniref:acyl carrier protein n=1 Tax=Streptomyces sp. NPDC037389 TaxID=3155369 RepID=UPI0033E3974F
MVDSLPDGGPPRELSWVERRDALEEKVVTQFKEALLMGEDEELELDTSFFDLGLTSLALGAMRKRLEDLLGVAIDATVLFNEPTVGRLVEYLAAAPSGPARSANSRP